MRANNNGDFLSGMHLAVAYLQFNEEIFAMFFTSKIMKKNIWN
jgi:hypothetical protein